MKIKALFLIVFLLSGSAFVLATPPEVPHRVYGEITDSGQTVSDVEIEFLYEEEVRGIGETNSDGFYDVNVDGSDGEQITVFVDNEETSHDFEFVTGSSMRLDIEANVDDSDDDSTEDDDSETDSGSGSAGGGSSTDSSSDPTLGGGLDETEDEETEETETEEEIFTLSEVEDSLTVDSLSQETEVVINKESENSGFTGFSFTTDSDIENLEVELRNMEVSPVESAEIDSVYNYGHFTSNYDLSGDLGLKVDKSVLNSENKDSSDILVYYYDSSQWVSLDYEVVGEDIENVYLDVAEAEQGYYALGSRSVQGFQGVQNVNFDTNVVEQGLNITVKGELRNERIEVYSETLEFSVDGEQVESKVLEAEPEDSEEFSFNYLIESEGEYEVRVNDFSEHVVYEGSDIISIVLLLAVVGVLGVTTIIGYLYIQSSRNVQKVDRRIEHIRRQQESMNKKMKDVRKNLSNVLADLDKE